MIGKLGILAFLGGLITPTVKADDKQVEPAPPDYHFRLERNPIYFNDDGSTRLRPHRVAIEDMTPEGGVFTADASVILNENLDDIYNVSKSFDCYLEWQMPFVNKSYVAEWDNDFDFFAFTSMSMVTLSSDHFMRVSLMERAPNVFNRAIIWDMVDKLDIWPEDSPQYKKYDKQDPSFLWHRGSWFMDELDYEGRKMVYVRYFLVAKLKGIDSFLGSIGFGFIEEQMKENIAKVFGVILREAQKIDGQKDKLCKAQE